MNTLLDFCVEHKKRIKIALIVSCIAVLFLGGKILFFSAREVFAVHFLDVGQGDSQLIKFPHGVEILIDGGNPNGRAVQELSEVMPANDRVIELVALTHPQLDHYGGLIETLKRYKVGVFLWNGRDSDAVAYQELKKTIKEKSIPTFVLRKGDLISYGDYGIKTIWPEEKYAYTKEPNDGSLVLELNSPNSRVLFTGDIGTNIEAEIAKFYKDEVDVLKVPHHGSKYSSSLKFLELLRPKVAVIGVGKNSYGHPTKDTLSRLASIGAQVFRTDQNGTVSAVFERDLLKIFEQR